MTSSEYVAERIRKEGVQYVFGYQGGSVTDIIRAICKTPGLNYIQAYHEQAAAFEADAYARISGKIGVCVVTNGPGLTNAVTAIADAYCDFVPLLVISGQVKTIDRNMNEEIRQNGFQEINSVGLVSSITKYAHTVESVEKLFDEIEKAISIATTSPYGPVLIDIPLDIQKEEVNKICKSDIEKKVTDTTDYQIENVLDAIHEAKKPIIVAGGGIRQGDAYEELCTLVEYTGIPVVRTLVGLDLITSGDIGFSGLYGEIASNLAIHKSDLLIVLGSRLSKRQLGIIDTYGPNARIIHIDINNAELGRIRNETISINADIKEFLNNLLIRIQFERINFDFTKWMNVINSYKNEHFGEIETNRLLNLKPVTALEKLSQLISDETVMTFDVGQNQMWCAQGIKPKAGQRIICSGGLGCMGFSMPAAIGAYYATKRSIIAFMGDGGFQMNIQELQYISANRIPIKMVVFNNKGLGMIQEVQMKFSNKEYFGSKIGYLAPDFGRLAKAYNLQYLSIKKDEDVDSSIMDEMMSNSQPAIIEFVLEGNPMRLLTMYDNIELYR